MKKKKEKMKKNLKNTTDFNCLHTDRVCMTRSQFVSVTLPVHPVLQDVWEDAEERKKIGGNKWNDKNEYYRHLMIYAAKKPHRFTDEQLQTDIVFPYLRSAL